MYSISDRIKNVLVVLAVLAFGAGLVLLLNIFLPLWLSVVIGFIATPIAIAILAAITVTVAYPVMAMYIVLLWGLRSEGKVKK
jgi:hypothetical protein